MYKGRKERWQAHAGMQTCKRESPLSRATWAAVDCACRASSLGAIIWRRRAKVKTLLLLLISRCCNCSGGSQWVGTCLVHNHAGA